MVTTRNKIEGSNSGDAFGNSVDLNGGGNTLAVGSIYNDDNGFNSGQVESFNYQDLAGHRLVVI